VVVVVQLRVDMLAYVDTAQVVCDLNGSGFCVMCEAEGAQVGCAEAAVCLGATCAAG
jgi:hypothetical protein